MCQAGIAFGFDQIPIETISFVYAADFTEINACLKCSMQIK